LFFLSADFDCIIIIFASSFLVLSWFFRELAARFTDMGRQTFGAIYKATTVPQLNSIDSSITYSIRLRLLLK